MSLRCCLVRRSADVRHNYNEACGVGETQVINTISFFSNAINQKLPLNLNHIKYKQEYAFLQK